MSTKKQPKALTEVNKAFLISLGYTPAQMTNATNFMCDQARKPGVTDQKASVQAALDKANARAEYEPRVKLPAGLHQYTYPQTKGFGANKKPHPRAGQWNGGYIISLSNGGQVFVRNVGDARELASVLPSYIGQMQVKA